MLGFLRRLRSSLIEENHLRKYLVYAVGEILLVMIGILLALQVNNWNQNRKDRIAEQEIVVELRKEFQENLRSVQETIAYEEMRRGAAVALRDALTGQASVVYS